MTPNGSAVCLLKFRANLLKTHPAFFDTKGPVSCLAGFLTADEDWARKELDRLLSAGAMRVEGIVETQAVLLEDLGATDEESAKQLAALIRHGYFLSIDAISRDAGKS